jgi:cell division protease FtsH
MNVVDAFIKKLIIYSSYVLYYPYWVWRNKSLRNVLIWLIILSLLVIEFFGLATLFALFGIAANFALSAIMMVGQFLILFTFLSNTKNVELQPGDQGTKTFENDFFGQDHIKEVVLGTIAMMSQENKEKMVELGAVPPAGAMLTGPPGTGKTLIAMCTASEVQVPYIGINGADFNAMFIGVGEMKVKALKSKARKWANKWGGCVVFIDEADAVMMSRGGTEGDDNKPNFGGFGGGIFGGGMGIRSQLLTAMDGTQEPSIRTDLINWFFRFFGFEELVDGTVFWLGATNRLGAIDGAFLRPGRMDITIQMDPPDRGSRRKIIQGYVNKIKTDDSVDVDRLTDDTQGITPADVAGAIERVAARFTMRDGRNAISHRDIESAILEQMFGVANPIAEFDEGQKEQVAVHEAGHALVTHLILPQRHITNLSIIRRGKGMLGFMRKVSPEEIYSMPLADVCAQIQISWAGDIACEVVMGERWTGGTGDFNSVDMMMKTLARHGYFADRLPLDPMNPFADPKIADAANNFADRVKSTTRRQISEHEVVIKAFRDALLEKGELNSAEIYGVLEEHGLHG